MEKKTKIELFNILFVAIISCLLFGYYSRSTIYRLHEFTFKEIMSVLKSKYDYQSWVESKEAEDPEVFNYLYPPYRWTEMKKKTLETFKNKYGFQLLFFGFIGIILLLPTEKPPRILSAAAFHLFLSS